MEKALYVHIGEYLTPAEPECCSTTMDMINLTSTV